jgi:hypothetical protein
LATLAIVSAAKHFNSLSCSRNIFTIVCKPPKSAIARRICVFLEISFRIFKAPILKKKILYYPQLSGNKFSNIEVVTSQK